MRERMRGPIQSQQKPWDKVLLVVVLVLCLAMFIVAGLDAVRFRTSHMPVWLEVLGAAGVALAIYMFHVVMRTNSYATAVVRIQTERGHQVISTGPYAFVRHPMYSGAILYFLGIALLLGLLVRGRHRRCAHRPVRPARRLGGADADRRAARLRGLRRSASATASSPASGNADVLGGRGMAKASDLRRIALSLEGTSEAPHFDRAAFKVKRIYATLAADGKTANLKLDPDEQEFKCMLAPEVFAPVPNAWGKQGWTTVTLAEPRPPSCAPPSRWRGYTPSPPSRAVPAARGRASCSRRNRRRSARGARLTFRQRKEHACFDAARSR